LPTSPNFSKDEVKLIDDEVQKNIGAFCLRMRENRSVRLQMADLLGGCEFCHGFMKNMD
jgi:hypothetical protein